MSWPPSWLMKRTLSQRSIVFSNSLISFPIPSSREVTWVLLRQCKNFPQWVLTRTRFFLHVFICALCVPILSCTHVMFMVGRNCTKKILVWPGLPQKCGLEVVRRRGWEGPLLSWRRKPVGGSDTPAKALRAAATKKGQVEPCNRLWAHTLSTLLSWRLGSNW